MFEMRCEREVDIISPVDSHYVYVLEIMKYLGTYFQKNIYKLSKQVMNRSLAKIVPTELSI